jgi:zinc and cadmium transporter
MESSLLNLLGLAFLGSVAGLIGGFIFLFNKSLSKALSSLAVPFAAGVLLGVSFLELLPEAVEHAGGSSFPIILSVFVILFLVERFLFHLHHHNGESHQGRPDIVPLVIFGDTIHNLLDGVAIGAAFLISPPLALVVAFATFLHETPHEIADFGILLSAGWKKNKAILANFLSALATFPGALLTFFYGDRIESLVGILLSVAAGFFLYISATDFLPEAKHAPEGSSFKNIAVFILGIVLIASVGIIFPHE